MFRSMLAAAFALSTLAVAQPALAAPGVKVRVAPRVVVQPAPRVVVRTPVVVGRPARPGPNYDWVPGHYRVERGVSVWVPGHWVRRPVVVQRRVIVR